MLFFLKPLRYLAQALAAQESPKQLAAGLALGVAAGLIPKSSLLAHLLLVVIAATQVNAGTGYLGAILVSAIARLFDPLLHPIGNALLSAGALRPLWTWLYNLPVAPWTEFNNTVVLGGLVVGAAAAYPVYLASLPAFEKYSETIGKRVRKWKVAQLLLGADLAGKLQ